MKNMIHSMLHTQMFDNIVDQYNSFRESRSHEAGENSSFQQVNFQFVSGNDIEAFHRIEQQQRERAGALPRLDYLMRRDFNTGRAWTLQLLDASFRVSLEETFGTCSTFTRIHHDMVNIVRDLHCAINTASRTSPSLANARPLASWHASLGWRERLIDVDWYTSSTLLCLQLSHGPWWPFAAHPTICVHTLSAFFIFTRLTTVPGFSRKKLGPGTQRSTARPNLPSPQLYGELSVGRRLL